MDLVIGIFRPSILRFFGSGLMVWILRDWAKEFCTFPYPVFFGNEDGRWPKTCLQSGQRNQSFKMEFKQPGSYPTQGPNRGHFTPIISGVWWSMVGPFANWTWLHPLRYYTLLSTGYGMAYLNQRAYDERPIYATRTFGRKKKSARNGRKAEDRYLPLKGNGGFPHQRSNHHQVISSNYLWFQI